MEYENVKCGAWNDYMDTLYSEEDKNKIEWSIGAVASWASSWKKKILLFRKNPMNCNESSGSIPNQLTTLLIIKKIFSDMVFVDLDFDIKTYSSSVNSRNYFSKDEFMFILSNDYIPLTQDTQGRIIEVRILDNAFSLDRLEELYSEIFKEIPSIVEKCIEVYQKLGPDYYDVPRKD